MDSDDELLPLSGLQHLAFCERQAALIHVEQIWRDNSLTLEGTWLHDRVDETAPRRECRGDLVIVRGLALRSARLGVSGRADVVEFHKAGPSEDTGVRLENLDGLWRPFPVEYKRGKPKPGNADQVQLCAQAMCLEEMLDLSLHEGALFYGRTQRRTPVTFDAELRAATEKVAERLHELFRSGTTPRAEREPKCTSCSLEPLCMPRAMTRRSSKRYLQRAVDEALEDNEDLE